MSTELLSEVVTALQPQPPASSEVERMLDPFSTG